MMGRLDPAAMVAEMNRLRPGLFEDWFAMWRTEPFGPSALNLMLAKVAAAAGGGEPKDFLPEMTDG